jgi:two-component system sensor histidine kinase/response regulator
VARLRERLSAGDVIEAQRLAHALKSAAGSVGAMSVCRWADALQAALRAGASSDETDTCIDALAATFQPLIDHLRASLRRP